MDELSGAGPRVDGGSRSRATARGASRPSDPDAGWPWAMDSPPGSDTEQDSLRSPKLTTSSKPLTPLTPLTQSISPRPLTSPSAMAPATPRFPPPRAPLSEELLLNVPSRGGGGGSSFCGPSGDVRGEGGSNHMRHIPSLEVPLSSPLLSSPACTADFGFGFSPTTSFSSFASSRSSASQGAWDGKAEKRSKPVDQVLQGPGSWAAKMEFLSHQPMAKAAPHSARPVVGPPRSVIAASAPELCRLDEVSEVFGEGGSGLPSHATTSRPKREPLVVPKGYPGWANIFDTLEASSPKPLEKGTGVCCGLIDCGRGSGRTQQRRGGGKGGERGLPPLGGDKSPRPLRSPREPAVEQEEEPLTCGLPGLPQLVRSIIGPKRAGGKDEQ